MHFNDHTPPHFRVRYQDQEVIVEIESGVVSGTMSQRALRLIFEWMDQHRYALRENWDRTQQRKALRAIPPLS